jgi:hypothetical protein
MEEKRDDRKLEREFEREIKKEEATEHELEDLHRRERELEHELEDEQKKEEHIKKEIEKERHHNHPSLFWLIFIVNGDDTRVVTNPSLPLRIAVERALVESGNSGRQNPDEWEVRDLAGVLLDMQLSPEKLRLSEGSRLFLSLRVGAGGCK